METYESKLHDRGVSEMCMRDECAKERKLRIHRRPEEGAGFLKQDLASGGRDEEAGKC